MSRLGYRVYSRCQDSYSKPRDQCRDYRGRGDYGYGSSSYDRSAGGGNMSR